MYMYEAILYIAVAYMFHCVSLIVVTITRHVFINISQTEHFKRWEIFHGLWQKYEVSFDTKISKSLIKKKVLKIWRGSLNHRIISSVYFIHRDQWLGLSFKKIDLFIQYFFGNLSFQCYIYLFSIFLVVYLSNATLIYSAIFGQCFIDLTLCQLHYWYKPSSWWILMEEMRNILVLLFCWVFDGLVAGLLSHKRFNRKWWKWEGKQKWNSMIL